MILTYGGLAEREHLIGWDKLRWADGPGPIRGLGGADGLALNPLVLDPLGLGGDRRLSFPALRKNRPSGLPS